ERADTDRTGVWGLTWTPRGILGGGCTKGDIVRYRTVIFKTFGGKGGCLHSWCGQPPRLPERGTPSTVERAGLQAEQVFLAPHAARVPGQHAVGADDPVARHHDAD